MNTYSPPFCHCAEEFAYKINDRNRGEANPYFSYLKCQKCGTFRIETIPEDLSSYYPPEYYKIPSLKEIEAKAQKDTFRISLVSKYLKSGNLLEVGPAFGIFGFQAKKHGFQVSAIEMDGQCCDFLNNVAHIPTQQSTEPELTMRNVPSQNGIALWHVIEHLPNPWALIETAGERLLPGGYLFIATPNPESFQHELMGKNWPHTDAPRHLYLLSSRTIIRHAKTCGLELVHLSTGDRYTKQMNRFGWQRMLMNLASTFPLKAIMYVIGYGLALLMSPWDNKEGRGSAYTLVLRKSNQLN